MGTLRVFNSEGGQIHPPGSDASTARYSNYFGACHLQAEFSADRPYLECYSRVHTERRKEQVYIRYDGDTPETLFEDCRAAVQSALVADRGWNFPERTQVEPSTLFHELVLDRSALSPLSLAGTPLAENELIVESLLANGEKQVTIHGRNFSILAGLVDTYSDVGCSIAVVDKPSIDTAADLVLAKASLVDTLEVPESTQHTIEQHARELARHRRERQYVRIEEAIAELAREGAEAEAVASELQRRVTRQFPDVRVLDPREVRRFNSMTNTSHRNQVRADGPAEATHTPGRSRRSQAANQASRSASGARTNRLFGRTIAGVTITKWVVAAVFAILTVLGVVAVLLSLHAGWAIPDAIPLAQGTLTSVLGPPVAMKQALPPERTCERGRKFRAP